MSVHRAMHRRGRIMEVARLAVVFFAQEKLDGPLHLFAMRIAAWLMTAGKQREAGQRSDGDVSGMLSGAEGTVVRLTRGAGREKLDAPVDRRLRFVGDHSAD